MKIEDFGGDDLKDIRELATSIQEGAQLLPAVHVHSSWDPSEVSDWLLTLKDELSLANEEIWALIHEVNREKT